MEKSRHTHPFRAILAAGLAFVMLAVLLFLMAPKASAAATVTDRIWLGGVQVTDANKDDILAGSGIPGHASYDPDTKTLTLDGVHIGKEHAATASIAGYASDALCSLRAQGQWTGSGVAKSNLTIVLKGKNSLEVEAEAGRPAIGMRISDKLTFQITGTGSLTVTATSGGTDEVAHGLSVYDNTGSIGTQDATSGPTITIHGDKSAVDFLTPKPADANTINLYSGNLSLTSKTSTPVETPGGGNQLCVKGGSLKVKTDMPQASAYRVLFGIWTDDMVILPGSNGGQHSAENDRGEVDIELYPYVIGTWIGYGKAGDYLMVPGQAKDLDPSDPVRTETGEDGTETEVGTYKDPTINVLGFTEDTTVYSVDVEWGAMTFQYEKSQWDPETHLETNGRGWMVYDTEKQSPLPDDTQNAINCVTVTNHSNAGVYAALSYAGMQEDEDYSKITGTFTKKDGDTATDFNETGNYLTLATADNNPGGKGQETVGKVYFMPQDDTTDPAYTTADRDIAKWQKIGKITVSITTTEPA